MSDKVIVKHSAGGIGLSGALLVLFVALKLTHNIEWSWLWVLSPVWIPAALALVVFLVALVFFMIT